MLRNKIEKVAFFAQWRGHLNENQSVFRGTEMEEQNNSPAEGTLEVFYFNISQIKIIV